MDLALARPELIVDVLGGPAVLGRRPVHTVSELDARVARGLPKRALRKAAERVTSSAGEARRLMFRIVPEATFKRRTRLSPAESERTERLARVIALAEFVWSGREDARQWLSTPHPELGGRAPLAAAATEPGARRVEAVLAWLFYGIPP